MSSRKRVNATPNGRSFPLYADAEINYSSGRHIKKTYGKKLVLVADYYTHTIVCVGEFMAIEYIFFPCDFHVEQEHEHSPRMAKDG